MQTNGQLPPTDNDAAGQLEGTNGDTVNQAGAGINGANKLTDIGGKVLGEVLSTGTKAADKFTGALNSAVKGARNSFSPV